jgi:cytochrome c2
MSQTRWAIDGSDDTSVELEGRKFASNDDGGPMLCNMVCKSMGRHVHVDICRGSASHNSETQHVIREYLQTPIKTKTGSRMLFTGAEWVGSSCERFV